MATRKKVNQMWSDLVNKKDENIDLKKETSIPGRCECGNSSFKLRVLNHRIMRKCNKCEIEIDLG